MVHAESEVCHSPCYICVQYMYCVCMCVCSSSSIVLYLVWMKYDCDTAVWTHCVIGYHQTFGGVNMNETPAIINNHSYFCYIINLARNFNLYQY